MSHLIFSDFFVFTKLLLCIIQNVFVVHLFEVGELCPKIIPTCAVIKIREQFPEENVIYRNFGAYNKEECISEIAKAWKYIGDVEEE